MTQWHPDDVLDLHKLIVRYGRATVIEQVALIARATMQDLQIDSPRMNLYRARLQTEIALIEQCARDLQRMRP